MSVRKKCGGGGCKLQDHRCDHTWVAQFIHRGTLYAVRVDEYVRLHDKNGKHISAKRDAEVVEARMLVDARAGRDPRLPPPVEAPPVVVAIPTVGQLLDDYAAARLPQLSSKALGPPKSELKHIRAFYGESDPVTDLTRRDYAQQFRLALEAGWSADYDTAPNPDGRGLVAVNRIQQRLRNVCAWALGQEPPRLASTPFHRYGVKIPTGDEVPRRRRLREGEEALLYQHADPLMALRLDGVLGLGTRQGELLAVRLPDVDFTKCTVTLRAETSKASPTRIVPFEPNGRLYQGLMKRRFLKAPDTYVFGAEDGSAIDSFRSAWETLLLTVAGKLPLPEGEVRTYEGDQALLRSLPDLLTFRDLRREYASRMWDRGLDLREIQLALGHASLLMTQRYLELSDTDGLAKKLGTALGWKPLVVGS